MEFLLYPAFYIIFMRYFTCTRDDNWLSFLFNDLERLKHFVRNLFDFLWFHFLKNKKSMEYRIKESSENAQIILNWVFIANLKTKKFIGGNDTFCFNLRKGLQKNRYRFQSGNLKRKNGKQELIKTFDVLFGKWGLSLTYDKWLSAWAIEFDSESAES